MVLHVLSTLSGIKCKRMLLCGQNLTFHSFSECRLTLRSEIVSEAELLAMATFLLNMCMFEVVFEHLKALTSVYPQQLTWVLWCKCAL